MGLVRPQIVLPAVLVEEKPTPDLAPILAHELVHLRRGDHWIAHLQLLAQAVWWFHPLVWWMNRQLVRAREMSCDEEVLATLDCQPADYAQTLLDVVRLRRAEQGFRTMPLALSMQSAEFAAVRLSHIMSGSLRFHRRTPRAAWVAAALAALAVLPGAAGGAESGRKSREPADGRSRSCWRSSSCAVAERNDDAARQAARQAAEQIRDLAGPASAAFKYCLASQLVAEVIRDQMSLHSSVEEKTAEEAAKITQDDHKKAAEAGKLVEEAKRERRDWHPLYQLAGEIDDMEGRINSAIANYQRAQALGSTNGNTARRLALLTWQRGSAQEVQPPTKPAGPGGSNQARGRNATPEKAGRVGGSQTANPQPMPVEWTFIDGPTAGPLAGARSRSDSRIGTTLAKETCRRSGPSATPTSKPRKRPPMPREKSA